MLRVLILFLLVFEVLFGFSSQMYSITDDGKIREAYIENKHSKHIKHRKVRKFLCLKNDEKTFKFCKKRKKPPILFKSSNGIKPHNMKIGKVNNKKLESYKFKKISDLEVAYPLQGEWNQLPNENYNFEREYTILGTEKETSSPIIITSSVNEESTKFQKRDEVSTEEIIIKKDLIIYIPLLPKIIKDEIQVALVDVLNWYRRKVEYIDVDIRFAQTIVVKYSKKREYEFIYHLFLPEGLLIKNKQNYSFNIHEALKKDKEKYKKIVVFNVFDDCKNPYSDFVKTENIFNLDTSRDCENIKDVLDIIKK